MAVYGLLGCGHCQPCAAGAENLCIHGMEGPPGIGFGVDGAHGRVPARRRSAAAGAASATSIRWIAAPLDRRRAHAVPRRQASAAEADPGLIGGRDRRRRSRASRRSRSSTALTPAKVIAVDTRESALDLADGGRRGQAAVLAGDDAAAAVIDATNGAKAEVVLDFVGARFDDRARRGGRPVRRGPDRGRCRGRELHLELLCPAVRGQPDHLLLGHAAGAARGDRDGPARD